ncbi:hypothetical protein [Flavobacterium caeni]|uniref:Uncharacterized protein n=1 Tax=Flavobacterium caeni TaxID=490189 RepID=A0A1G5JAM2_9FLAO|nr:hypothetical protein [Flavobacterium caeni]SCY85423.1 hypothetical protein SAMN02927903_02603 [Flavobacterium caeni]
MPPKVFFSKGQKPNDYEQDTRYAAKSEVQWDGDKQCRQQINKTVFSDYTLNIQNSFFKNGGYEKSSRHTKYRCKIRRNLAFFAY